MAGSTSASTSSPTKNAAAAQDELVLVMDFGSQTAQLITRRVRDQNVFCQLVRHDLTADRIKALNPKGLILSGGPASVYGEGSPKIDPAIFKLGIPILGDRIYPQLLPEGTDDPGNPLRLLAERLQFTDPITGQARDFVSQFTLDFPDPLSFS